MEQILYERPREKLQAKGVAALTTSELLQVIIGSGNARMSVIKIARKASKLLLKEGMAININSLVKIPGLGAVKAGQIVAGLELATRLREGQIDMSDKDIFTDLYIDVRSAKKQTLLYVFFDGGSRVISDRSVEVTKGSSVKLVRSLFAEALSQSAVSVAVIIGSEKQSLEPDTGELSLAHEIYKTANLLSISVKSFTLINQSGQYVLKEASNGK